MMHNHRTWCEIDLNALLHNLKQFKNKLSDSVKTMAVVKADAYGHGAAACARALVSGGADYLAVAFIDEALELREAGITSPVLILGYTDPSFAEDIVKNNITASVYDIDQAKHLSDAAAKLQKPVKVHIKTDTGMSRIGFKGEAKEIAQKIAQIKDLPYIEIEGIFTHFAKADEQDRAFTDTQFERFISIINEAETLGISFKIRHCCNSAAAMLYPNMHLDMVRVGIALYGCYPSEIQYPFDLKPVMTFKSRVINIKTIKKGDIVSYGGIYKAERDIKIATVAAGYADGYVRGLSNSARVLINNSFAKITGRICMDQCMIDVTSVNNISVGDEVVLFGTKDGACLPVEELADKVGTISYEILCGIAKRVPRLYPDSL